jgi:hypothetical protein
MKYEKPAVAVLAKATFAIQSIGQHKTPFVEDGGDMSEKSTGGSYDLDE